MLILTIEFLVGYLSHRGFCFYLPNMMCVGVGEFAHASPAAATKLPGGDFHIVEKMARIFAPVP